MQLKFDRRWKAISLFIGFLISFITSVFIAIHAPAKAQIVAQANRSEIRGVWITNVDSNVMFDRTRLSNAIQELAQLNFNTLYPAVWNWGYTTYPSPIAQSMTGAIVDPRPISLEGRDALAELVQLGHQRGMAVIPWFEFGFMTPEDSALAIRHPDWLTQRQNGDQTWQEGIYPRVWLNPFRPEIQQFILNLVMELVTRYNIDGIQFDDHFGLPVEFGYDDFTIQLYRREHQGQAPPSNPRDPEWMRWRANKITEFLGRVFRAVKAQRNNVLVTLSPNNYSFSYNESLQDWQTWERQGLIEELVLQVYRDSTASFLNELRSPEVQNARLHIPTAVGVLTGLKRRAMPISQVQTQVQTIRNQKFAGVSFFFYETMWNLVAEPTTIRKAGFKALFPTRVSRPDMIRGWTPPV